MEWLNQENLLKLGEYALVFLGAATALLHVVSPLTRTKKDDDALSILRRIEGWLFKVVTPKKLR